MSIMHRRYNLYSFFLKNPHNIYILDLIDTSNEANTECGTL